MIPGGKMAEKSNESFPVHNADLTKSSIDNKSISNAAVFDPFFGIKITSPRFSLEIFNTYCNELHKTSLASLTSTSLTVGSVVMGVIIETTGICKSLNGKDFLVWYLSDLMSDKKVKLLIFGDAVQTHSKLQPGFVVAVTNSELADDNKQATGVKLVTLKVFKSLQIMPLGLCSDFGTCTELRKNGERCTNYVNVSLSSVCVYHIQAEAKKLRSIRGSLSAISNEPPKSMMFKSPVKKPRSAIKSKNRTNAVKRVHSLKGSSGVISLNESLPSPAIVSKARLGHKLMEKFRQDQQAKVKSNELPSTSSTQLNSNKLSLNAKTEQEPFASSLQSPENKAPVNVLRDFLNRKDTEQKLEVIKRAQQLRQSLPPQRFGLNSSLPQKVQPRKRNAAVLFKKSQETDENLKKRKLHEDENLLEERQIIPGKELTNEKVTAWLENELEYEAIQTDCQQKLHDFQKREVEEKIETHTTTLMEIKNVDVVTCKTCNYTTAHLTQRCEELKHDYVKHKASRRFFKCNDCQTRTVCYELMPSEPCTHCSCMEFVQVAIRDERKVEREKLLIRSEERKFVII